MEEKRNWGGKREGSGRKAKEVESTTVSIKLNNDLLEAFPKLMMGKNGKLVKYNRSEYINDAVREKMNKDGLLKIEKP